MKQLPLYIPLVLLSLALIINTVGDMTREPERVVTETVVIKEVATTTTTINQTFTAPSINVSELEWKIAKEIRKHLAHSSTTEYTPRKIQFLDDSACTVFLGTLTCYR